MICVAQMREMVYTLDKPEYAAFVAKELYTIENPEYGTHYHGYEIMDYLDKVKKELEKL